MLQSNKKEKLFFSFFAVFLVLLFLFIKYRNQKLSTDGRFTLGVINNYESSKSGQIYSVDYFFKGEKFSLSFSDVGVKFNKGQLLFIEVSANNPKLYDILNYKNIKVPSCIKITDVPMNGWSKISLDTCK